MTTPPLPEPCCWGYDVPDAPLPHGRGLFNADQMREYGATCAAAERERCDVYRAERDQSRGNLDNCVRILSGIHALLYPPPINTPDGRTMVFRPKGLDTHEVLQELSDRIRAIPDEIAAAIRAKETT